MHHPKPLLKIICHSRFDSFGLESNVITSGLPRTPTSCEKLTYIHTIDANWNCIKKAISIACGFNRLVTPRHVIWKQHLGKFIPGPGSDRPRERHVWCFRFNHSNAWFVHILTQTLTWFRLSRGHQTHKHMVSDLCAYVYTHRPEVIVAFINQFRH